MSALSSLEAPFLQLLWQLHTPWLDAVMVFVSRLGDHGLLWVALAAALTIPKRIRRMGLCMAAAMAMAALSGNLLLKPLIARPRPYLFDPSVHLLLDPGDPWSFPSGHTMNGVAAATAVRGENRRWGAAALAVAALIAFSRLYLYLHYPSDLLGGALLGWACARLARRLVEKAAGPAAERRVPPP